jgi:predicted XRE-type DNA-binding protein
MFELSQRAKEYVASLEMVVCNRRLLDILKGEQKKSNLSLAQISKMMGVEDSRLSYLMEQERPLMYREEVSNLALGTATPMEVIFDLPGSLNTPEVILACMKRYEWKNVAA